MHPCKTRMLLHTKFTQMPNSPYTMHAPGGVLRDISISPNVRRTLPPPLCGRRRFKMRSKSKSAYGQGYRSNAFCDVNCDFMEGHATSSTRNSETLLARNSATSKHLEKKIFFNESGGRAVHTSPSNEMTLPARVHRVALQASANFGERSQKLLTYRTPKTCHNDACRGDYLMYAGQHEGRDRWYQNETGAGSFAKVERLFPAKREARSRYFGNADYLSAWFPYQKRAKQPLQRAESSSFENGDATKAAVAGGAWHVPGGSHTRASNSNAAGARLLRLLQTGDLEVRSNRKLFQAEEVFPIVVNDGSVRNSLNGGAVNCFPRISISRKPCEPQLTASDTATGMKNCKTLCCDDTTSTVASSNYASDDEGPVQISVGTDSLLYPETTAASLCGQLDPLFSGSSGETSGFECHNLEPSQSSGMYLLRLLRKQTTDAALAPTFDTPGCSAGIIQKKRIQAGNKLCPRRQTSPKHFAAPHFMRSPDPAALPDVRTLVWQ